MPPDTQGNGVQAIGGAFRLDHYGVELQRKWLRLDGPSSRNWHLGFRAAGLGFDRSLDRWAELRRP